MRNKKTRIAIISVVALLLVLIGVTYAYWLVTKTQTNSNIISSACLDITLDNEANDISLSSQYPMSDEDGIKNGVKQTLTIRGHNESSKDLYYGIYLNQGKEEVIHPQHLQNKHLHYQGVCAHGHHLYGYAQF